MPLKPFFERFAYSENAEGVRREVGYEVDTLNYVWETYSELLPREYRKPIYVYNAYKYVHMYPSRTESGPVLQTSSTVLHDKVLPTLHHLAHNLDEIHWEERLNPYNHTPDFPFYVTGIVDTFPVQVLEPIDSTLHHETNNPKYMFTCYKAQMVVDFLGRLTCFSGPHLGLGTYDGRRRTRNIHPTLPWEFIMGDGHYIAESDVIVPYRQDGNLTQDEMVYNGIFQHYRSRIEMANAAFKKHIQKKKNVEGRKVAFFFSDCGDMVLFRPHSVEDWIYWRIAYC